MWNQVNETLVDLDAFRREYATKSAGLTGDIKKTLMDSNDAYFSESQNVYEWASVVQPILKVSIKVSNSDGIKKALTKVLDTGLTKLGAAQEKLEQSSNTFNTLAASLKEVNSQFETEFEKKSKSFDDKLKELRAEHKDEKGQKGGKSTFEKDLVPLLNAKMAAIKKFHGDLTQTITEELRNIDSTKAKLSEEIENIVNLKSKIDPIKTSLNSDSDSKQSAQDLIDTAEKYRERHNKKNQI